MPLSAFGIRAATARATSVQPKLLVPASRMPVRTVGTAGPNPTCPLCETNVRTICTGKYESEEFAGRVSRAGGTPVVVAGVRSPFGYYVRHYFYALHAQQQSIGIHHTGGLAPLGFRASMLSACKKNRTSESCRAMTHVIHEFLRRQYPDTH